MQTETTVADRPLTVNPTEVRLCPCNAGVRYGGEDLCRACREKQSAPASIDARHERLHVETICGMALRYGPNRWVLATDIRGVWLHASGTLTLKTASCGHIDIADEPWLGDLCAELQVGGQEGRVTG